MAWRFWHYGVVVRDVEKAVNYYQSFGIGPFKTAKERLVVTNKMFYGKPAGEVKSQNWIAPVGPIHMELCQPISGQYPNREFLDRHGEGISHIAFFVDDISEETAKMAERGFSAIWSGQFAGGGGYAYFDTDKIGGVMFELVQKPPETSSEK